MEYAPQGVSCQLNYFRSIPGVLKIIEILCDLLGTILAGAAPLFDGFVGHRGFFLFVSIVAMIITIVLLVLAVLNIHNVILKGRWPLIELCWCVFIALFYFIASIVIATVGKYNGAYGAAAFFGFAAFITYIADAVFQFRTHRSASQSQNEQQYAPNTQHQQQYAPNTQHQQQYAPNPQHQQPYAQDGVPGPRPQPTY